MKSESGASDLVTLIVNLEIALSPSKMFQAESGLTDLSIVQSKFSVSVVCAVFAIASWKQFTRTLAESWAPVSVISTMFV